MVNIEKFGLLTKISFIILATYLATNMPEYINPDVTGFVPSEEIVSKNLYTDNFDSEKQVSFFDIENDIGTEELNLDSGNISNEQIDDGESRIGLDESGQDLDQVLVNELELRIDSDKTLTPVLTDTLEVDNDLEKISSEGAKDTLGNSDTITVPSASDSPVVQ